MNGRGSSRAVPRVPTSDLPVSAPSTNSQNAETRLQGRTLRVARSLVFAAIGVTLALYALALPGLYPHIAVPCANAPDSCAMNPEQVAPLAALGLTPSALAVIVVAVTCAAIVLVTCVAAVLIWRRSNDWMALFLALTLILLPGNFTGVMQGLPDGLQVFGVVISDASLVTLFVLIGLFPSGRFVPRWLWIPTFIMLAEILVPTPPAPDDLSTNLVANVLILLQEVVTLVVLITLVAGQIYRYRRVASPVQRQQIKWGVYGLVLAIVINQAFWQPVIWFPALQQPNSLYMLLVYPDSVLMIAVIAIAFGVAILRFNLYDIDVLVNRALVYGSLTAILAAVYVGGVVGSQAIISGLTHSDASGEAQPPFSIVVTTLIIAALFQPLRRRIQAFIDRRFYRSKYNVERTLAAFARSLREEVNMPDLTENLLRVVDETMQPMHVSLWLRQSDHRANQP